MLGQDVLPGPDHRAGLLFPSVYSVCFVKKITTTIEPIPFMRHPYGKLLHAPITTTPFLQWSLTALVIALPSPWNFHSLMSWSLTVILTAAAICWERERERERLAYPWRAFSTLLMKSFCWTVFWQLVWYHTRASDWTEGYQLRPAGCLRSAAILPACLFVFVPVVACTIPHSTALRPWSLPPTLDRSLHYFFVINPGDEQAHISELIIHWKVENTFISWQCL